MSSPTAPSTILIVGATGNTGQGAVETLSSLLNKDATSDFRILGLTRSSSSPISVKLASLPSVSIIEKDWTTLDAAWLLEHNVVKAYVAAHNEASQFVDESALYAAFLTAGVKYVVRVSTHREFVGPAKPIYYGRAHWAIENLLAQPEVSDRLKSTSLSANYFTNFVLGAAAQWLKAFKTDGTIGPLVLTQDEHIPVAAIDPYDVGVVGAHLLALSSSSHFGRTYVLAGPENKTGADLVALVEKLAGVKIPQVIYKNIAFIEEMVAAGMLPSKLAQSLREGINVMWTKGTSDVEGMPTSREVVEGLGGRPKGTYEGTLRRMHGA